MPNAAPPRKPGEAHPVVQIAILVGFLALLLNAGFYFMSDSYFEDRAKRFGLQELARLDGARVDFAIFTIVLGLGAFAAAAVPRLIAQAIPGVAAVASFVAAGAGVSKGVPIVLCTTLLIVAGALGLLLWQSIEKRSRSAWASLTAMCIVFGIVTLFGAPKLRGMFDVGLWIAMIVPGVFGVGIAGLYQIRGDYQESAAR